MFTLGLINQKGGVGKTTSAVTIAHGLALAGARTLLVDLDCQGNVADALGLVKEGGVYRMLFEEGPAVKASGRERLEVVLGDHSTYEAKQRLAGQSFREFALRDALDGLEYDVVVLDVAPGVDVLQVGALVACTGFLVPVALDHLAVVGATVAMKSAAALTSRGGQAQCGRFLGVLPTFWERTTKESHEQLQVLVEQFGKQLWPPIPVDVKAREAPAYGRTLWEYAADCRALNGVELGGMRRGGYKQVLVRLGQVIGNGKGER